MSPHGGGGSLPERGARAREGRASEALEPETGLQGGPSSPGHSRLPTPISQEGLTLLSPSERERPRAESWSTRRGSRGHPVVDGKQSDSPMAGGAHPKKGVLFPDSRGCSIHSDEGHATASRIFVGRRKPEIEGEKESMSSGGTSPSILVPLILIGVVRCCQLRDDRAPAL